MPSCGAPRLAQEADFYGSIGRRPAEFVRCDRGRRPADSVYQYHRVAWPSGIGPNTASALKRAGRIYVLLTSW